MAKSLNNIQVTVVGTTEDFVDQDAAAERAGELAKAGAMVQMEFIGETSAGAIRRLETVNRKLRRSLKAQQAK